MYFPIIVFIFIRMRVKKECCYFSQATVYCKMNVFRRVLFVFTQNKTYFRPQLLLEACSCNRRAADACVCQEPQEHSSRSWCPLLVCVHALLGLLLSLEGVTLMQWNQSILCDTKDFHLLCNHVYSPYSWWILK